VLLEAGADPNAGELELPLTAALMASEKAGLEPLRMLLAAGAYPNKPDSFGSPAYFLATGIRVHPGALPLLLDRGANLELRARDGATALRRATDSQNWPATLLLLQRGANWRETRMLNGTDFHNKIEADVRVYGDEKGLAEVLRFVHEDAGKAK
jgi:ankyrin repeat protein